MNYTVAETGNVRDGERVTIHRSGNKYYLEFEGDGGHVLSREGGREMFDGVGRYVTECLYSYEYEADLVKNA